MRRSGERWHEGSPALPAIVIQDSFIDDERTISYYDVAHPLYKIPDFETQWPDKGKLDLASCPARKKQRKVACSPIIAKGN